MLTNEQKARYARHLLLPEFGEKAQEKLLGSKVLLIGAGGLGSPVALYLVAAGIGQLTIIDPDQVELSNLQRQILHTEGDIGLAKVESAQRHLKALNSETEVTIIKDSFSIHNASELISTHDIVIDGSDNFPTRFLVNDACYFERKPLIYGSIFQYEGQLTVFDTAEGSPCYRCLVPELPEEGAVPNCLEAGVIGTLPGIIGSLQAMETIKFICGIGTPPIGEMLYYNALGTDFKKIKLSKDPACPLCSVASTIHELSFHGSATCQLSEGIESITAEELKIKMSENPSLFLIDVREPEEYAERRIPTSQLIPLKDLEMHTDKLPMKEEIYIHCKSGSRSAKACELLRKKGHRNIINISDGIDGWK